jgi:N-carbamoylputrescine amidase
MRLAVCEAPAEMVYGDQGWQRLAGYSTDLSPDALLLNEMPFGGWLSADPEPVPDKLVASHALHDGGLAHLSELGARIVLGSRPTFERERSVNAGFVWTADSGIKAIHTKQFFPDEAGYYEARWFERGDLRFQLANFGGIKVGFLICTDVMFPEWARYYGRRGAHVIAVPRATPEPSLNRWKTVMAACAVISGCYVASSNRFGMNDSGQEFGGKGWIFGPSGRVRAETSKNSPVVEVEIDLNLVSQAKAGYPSYVNDLPPREVMGLLEM